MSKVIEQCYFSGYIVKENDAYKIPLSRQATRCSAIRFTNIQIPVTWYNVDSRWNTFSLIEYGHDQITITIPPNNYEIDALISTIQDLLNTASTHNHYSVRLSMQTGLLTIQADTIPIEIVYGDKYDFLNGMLGFWSSPPHYSLTQVADTIFNFNPISEILLHSNIVRTLSKGSIKNELADSSDVFYTFNTQNKVFGDMVLLEDGISLNWVSTDSHELTSFTFTITDQENRLINFNGAEISGTFELQYVPSLIH